jgi:glycosyltransferase involved in cell wall biosynthesis
MRGSSPNPASGPVQPSPAFTHRTASAAGRLYMALERGLARATDAVIFESAYAAARYAAQVGKVNCAIRTIPNGLRAADFEPPALTPTAADFLFVGELRHLKGIDVLLAAAARVYAVHPIRAVIVGDGPDAAACKAQVSKQGLDEVVTFVGALPVAEAFRLGRVLVVPSRTESFPYIVLEAAAAGLPVLATAVGGIPEIMAATDTRLIAPEDVAGLAQAMLDVLVEPEAARARAARLRESVARRLTVWGMTDGILDLYASFTAKA